MDLLRIADQVADPSQITAKTVSALQAAVGHVATVVPTAAASTTPSSLLQRKTSTRNARPPRQRRATSPPGIVDSQVLAGALRVLQSCSTAMGVITENCRTSQAPLGATWACRRAHVLQMCTIALTAIPPLAQVAKLFSAEKKLCNIVSLAMDAQVPVDECLDLAQALKSRIETIGVHQGWLLPSPADSAMLLLPNPACAIPDRTLVQLASVCLLRILHTQLASDNPNRALDQLADAVRSNTAGHLGWWLAHLESMHGPQASQPQYLFAARQLARAQPPSQLVSTIVDWLVRANASTSELQVILNRLPAPAPLAPALAHLTRHPQISIGCADLVHIAIMWTVYPCNNSGSVTQLPSDVAAACDWLRVHAANIPIDHPDIWTLHLAVLLIQATKAISGCVAHHGPFSPQAIKALEYLLPHLRSRTHPDKNPLARNQAMIALRTGDRFVQVARHFTDRLDPDNPFVTKDSWAIALVHDCVSQMVAQLFPYLAESRTAARMLVEWLMYNAQLMAKAKEMAKVERSLDTAVKVCLHGALTSADDGSQSLVSCLKRISTVAATYASAARNRNDVAGAMGLTKVAAAALEALMSRATEHRSALAPSLASRLEMVAVLAAQLGLRRESHTFMRRALALTTSYGSTADVWTLCLRYVTQSLSALAYPEGEEDEREMLASVSTDSLADSALADLSSQHDEEADPMSEGGAGQGGPRQQPAKYVRLSSMVPEHWVFFFEWRALVSAGHLLLAAAVLDAWDAATPHERLVARGHVALCKASQAGECGGSEYAEEAVELLKNASLDSSNIDLPEYCTELLATAYCFLALLRDDLAHLATAFTLFKNAKKHDRLPLICDTRWHLRKLEAVLLGHCQYHLLIQLYEVQLLLEKDSARGNVFVRLAEAYLDLGYIGQAGHCLSTGAAYLAPHERARWNPVYTMYLLATGNPAKAATFAEGVASSSSSSSSLKGGRADGGAAKAKAGSESAETMFLARMARAQLLHSQGQGPAALEAAMQSLAVAAKVPSPTYQLRLLSFISRLFADLGIWSDAESHARKGMRWSTRGKNAAMQTHFASLCAAVALRRRAIDDARAALSSAPAGISSGSSAHPPLRRVSSFPSASASPSRSPMGIPRPSTPASGASPPRPAVAQDASANALVNKEQVVRLVLLGEAALLEQASSDTQLAQVRITKLRSPMASVDDATAHELRARLLLDTLKKPRLVAELFHNNSDPLISTPRIQHILTATAQSGANASSDKLQRMAMIALDAEVTRLRAAVLAAQGKTSDAATLLIQQVREFTAPVGFNRAQFVHDAAATILASLEPHIARVPEAAAVKDSVTLHDLSPARHSAPDVDSRVVRRLKFVYDLLKDSVDTLAGTAHPGLLHGIGCMVMYIQDVARAFVLSDFVDSSWPVHRVADMTCHGVTLKRMVTLFGPKHGGSGLNGEDKRPPSFSASTSRRSRTASSPTRSARAPAAKRGPSADSIFLQTPPEKTSRHQSDTNITTPTPTTPSRRSRKSRSTPRTDGQLEEEMLCLMLDEGGDSQPNVQSTTPDSMQLTDLLPGTWTVGQMCIDSARNILTLIVRTRTDQVTLRLPLTRRELILRMPKDKLATATYASVRSMLDAIVHESDRMLRGTYETRDDKLKWWDTRERLNRELEAVVARLDDGWLGCFRKVLVAGKQSDRGEFMRRVHDYLAPYRKGSPSAVPELELPALVVNGWLALGRTVTVADVEDVTYFVLNECLRQGYPVATAGGGSANSSGGSITFDSLMLFLAKTFKSLLSKSTPESIVVQDHTVLILDKHAHPFPWESTTSLAGRSVSRVFSQAMLTDLLAARHKRVVSKESVYYCINPGGDLTATQERFQEIVRANASWRGTTGSAPSQSQFLSHISNTDVFLFIGHNGGEQLCPPKRILAHSSGPAVALLLGCSSGKLSAPGDFDPIGTPMHYTPHSLCVVGNLWDVTDRDIDRFTVAMLAGWGLISRDSVLPAGDGVVPESNKKGSSAGQEVARNMAADVSCMKDRVLPSKIGQGRRADAAIGGGDSRAAPARPRASLPDTMDLSKALAQARFVCKLRYLNGAAPVVYGIPVHLTQ